MKRSNTTIVAAVALVACSSVSLAMPKIETMAQLQAHTDDLIKIAQSDMSAWTKPKSSDKSVSQTTKRAPRATRTVPVVTPKAEPKPKPKS